MLELFVFQTDGGGQGHQGQGQRRQQLPIARSRRKQARTAAPRPGAALLIDCIISGLEVSIE